ncbi:atypical/HisK protein kinase [Coprinopsis sp. MPI-PUGE-AT-0042]|nr:atypical/HisK protein kinase [Coprinopsis sp. MPI-PUGE-AT-0042]
MVSKLADQVRPISDVTKDVAAGDLTELVDVDTQGEMLDLKMAVNSAVSQLSAPANEMARVLLEVGTEGILSGQTAVLDVQGMRKALANNVHLVAMNLTNQARSIFQVTKALASVDLTKKTDVGTRGEILELKEAANDASLVNTINDAIEQLAIFAAEVNKVAREAEVGIWQEIMLSVDTLAGNLTTRVHSFAQISAAAADGDFTRLITVEGEMDSLKTQINQKESTAAHEAAELANRSGSEFLANRSHEIRMSMNGVIDMTDLIDSGLNRPQRESLLLAHSLARSLLLIIDDVLGISNIEAGRMAVEAAVFGTLKALAVCASQNQLNPAHDVDPNIPDQLVFIPSKVNRRGQVALSTRLLAMDDQSITLEFSAADAGIGIAKDKDNLIFDTFCQAGLGLFISERAVSLMQDNMWVESEAVKGSKFCFAITSCKCTIIFGDTLQDTTGAEDRIKDLSLRLYLIHEVREVADKDNCRCIDTTCVDLLNILKHFRYVPVITTPVSAQDLTLSLISALESNPVSPISAPNNVTFAIVHAEDDSVNQKLAVKILKKYGHSVEIVESGGLLSSAHTHKGLPSSPIIALAAHATIGDRERCLQAKMDHHITRPPRRGDLLNAISKLAGANRKEPLMYRPPIAPGPSYA